jgi:DNA-binding MarR family transcriptional regulator
MAFRPHPALARNTGFLLSRVGDLTRRRFAEQLATLDLTPRMFGTLNVLDAEGAITQHALCKGVGMDPSSMVATLDELEARGLVERRQHPQDRRAHALHLTDAGQEVLGRARQVARAAQQELLGVLSSEERAQLHELLLRLASGLGGAHR